MPAPLSPPSQSLPPSPPPPSPSPQSAAAAWWPAALVLAVGSGLRLHGLSVHSFWYDEAASLAVATADDPWSALRGDRHPPLFFLLLRGWHALVGADDAALRTLPALLGIAALLGLHVVARRLLSPRASLLATALFAAAPFQVWYAQELRMYVLLELGTVVALLGATATATATGRTAVRAALLAGGAALALGSHYFGFLVPALCAPFVWRGRDRRSLALLLAPIAGLVVWLPWLVLVVPEQMRTPWAFQARLGARDLLELPVRWFVVIGSALPAWLPLAVAGLVAAGLVGALRLAWQRDAAARALLASLALAALALLLAFVVLPPTLQPFYAIGVAPVATLLVAHGLARGLPHGVWAGAALAAVCTIGTLVLRAGNQKEDYRGATADLARAFAPGDVVVAVTGTPEFLSQAGLRHYLREQPAARAAIAELPELLERLERGERVGPGDGTLRLQVLYRDRLYAAPTLQRLRARARVVHEGVDRAGLRHLTLVVPR